MFELAKVYLIIVSSESFLNHHFILFVFSQIVMLMLIAPWAARRYTAELRFGRPKFKYRLMDFPDPVPFSLSHFASYPLYIVLSH